MLKFELKRRDIEILIPRLKLLINTFATNPKNSAETVAKKMNWNFKHGKYMIIIIMYILFSSEHIPTQTVYSFKKKEEYSQTEKKKLLREIMKNNDRINTENNLIHNLNNLDPGPLKGLNNYNMKKLLDEQEQQTEKFIKKLSKYYRVAWNKLDSYKSR